MMARVFGVISGRMVSAVMLPDSGSTSATTGTHPRITAALAQAMKVRLVVITSAPSPIPNA